MLTKLSKEEAVKAFPNIWKAVADSLYCKVDDVDMQQKVLAAIERGALQAWVVLENDTMIGITLTTLVYHAVEDVLTLLIYAAYAASDKTPQLRSGLSTLNKFAAESGCATITYFTNQPNLIKFAQLIGGHLEAHISIPVMKG